MVHLRERMSAKSEKIAALEDAVQAQLLHDILSDRGVPHVMCCYHSTPYDGLFQMVSGWGHIEAPAEYREQILAILADLDEGVSEAQDDPTQDS